MEGRGVAVAEVAKDLIYYLQKLATRVYTIHNVRLMYICMYMYVFKCSYGYKII